MPRVGPGHLGGVDARDQHLCIGDGGHCCRDLAYGDSASVAEIEDEVVPDNRRVEREHVRLRPIPDLHVVADRGAGGFGLVDTVQRCRFRLVGGDREPMGNQMRLVVVPFAVPAVGAGDVEVPQTRRRDAVGARRTSGAGRRRAWTRRTRSSGGSVHSR